MPHVIVQYRQELTDSAEVPVLRYLKRAIRERAAAELSVEERKLTEGNFSFMFLKEGEDDELIADVQVIIFAHADEFRVRACDGLAESISQAVDMVLANLRCHRQREFLYSVTLFLGEMGYYEDAVTSWDYQRFVDPSAAARLKLPIDELPVSVKVYNNLTRVGIESIADVEGATEQELLAIPHLGPKGIEEIKTGLGVFGLRLSDEDSRRPRPKWVIDPEERLRSDSE